MSSRDRTQHGWKEQYRPDGGADLHHGTGQTFKCLFGDRYSAVCCDAVYELLRKGLLVSSAVNRRCIANGCWRRLVYRVVLRWTENTTNVYIEPCRINLFILDMYMLCILCEGVGSVSKIMAHQSGPPIPVRLVLPLCHRWGASSPLTLQTCTAWMAFSPGWGPGMILRPT